MREDAIKWNERYKQGFMPSEPSAFVINACDVLKDIFSLEVDLDKLDFKKTLSKYRAKSP